MCVRAVHPSAGVYRAGKYAPQLATRPARNGLGYVLSNGQCDDLGFVTLPVDTPSYYPINNQEYGAPWLSTSMPYANTATPTYMQRSLGSRFATNGLPLQIPASVGAPEERITTLRTYSFEMMKHASGKLSEGPIHRTFKIVIRVRLRVFLWDVNLTRNELSAAAGLPECYDLSQEIVALTMVNSSVIQLR